MDFTVIKLAGKQYLVSDDSVIDVAADLGKVGDKLTFSEVLLTSIGDKLQVGEPLVTGAQIFGEVVFSGRGTKLHVSKFKAKSRYRKTIGFRPALTKIKILNLSSAKEEKKVVEEKPKITRKTVKVAKK